MIPVLYTGCCILLILAYAIYPRRPKNLPPGPKPWLLFGNLFDVPTQKPWLKYASWKEQYGDVVYLNVLGRHLVVLNSVKASTDLLEKRSAKYSDRPSSIMISELMGWNFSFAVMGYTTRWRTHRKLFHQYFSERVVPKYRPAQERSAHTLLRRLLSDPERFMDHFRLSFAQTIMDVMYGIKVEECGDVYVTTAEHALQGLSAAFNQGSFLVDILPALKYIPSWLPGADFQRKAAEWREQALNLRGLPYQHVKRSLVEGTAQPSVMASMLEVSDEEKSKIASGLEHNETYDEIAANAAGVGYSAGADTTLAVVTVFCLAMIKYPKAQQAAQEEISRVTGNDRLPTFTDMKDMPYVRALIKETLRWHSVAPMGIAHALTEDDEYNGYFLPKGTIVMPNTWNILHDPEVYPNPFEFEPSRWLVSGPEGLRINPDIPDSSHIAFGYGRRICAGRHFAEDSLFIIISTMLASFNITAALDKCGQPKHVEVDFTNGALSTPVPYEAHITPRSPKAARLVSETETK